MHIASYISIFPYDILVYQIYSRCQDSRCAASHGARERSIALEAPMLRVSGFRVGLTGRYSRRIVPVTRTIRVTMIRVRAAAAAAAASRRAQASGREV